MNIFATDPNRTITLGRIGEDVVDEVRFPISAWREKYGADSTFSLLNKRAQDSTPYVIANTEECPDHITVTETEIIWKITATDTAYKGAGEAEVWCTPADGGKAKSEIFHTKVEYAFSDSGDAPTPYDDILDEIVDAKDAAEAAAVEAEMSAEDAAIAAESAVETKFGNLTASASSVTADEPASATYDAQANVLAFEIPMGHDGNPGAPGFSPVVSTNKVGKETRITIQDATHTETATILDGADGTDGVTDVLFNGSSVVENHVASITAPTTSEMTEVVGALQEETEARILADAALGTRIDNLDIPTKTSELQNDGDGTNAFLTQHQDISGKLDETTFDTFIGNYSSLDSAVSPKLDKVTSSGQGVYGHNGSTQETYGVASASGVPVVTSISASSTNDQIPTAKAVWDLIQSLL